MAYDLIQQLTWIQFDWAVETITARYTVHSFSGVYGVPRGGVCLAVALSHSLALPWLPEPKEGCLVVDDVYETGITLNNFKDIEGANFFVLFSKMSPTWWNTVHLSEKSEWIVFPWEDNLNSQNDYNDFIKKRGLN